MRTTLIDEAGATNLPEVIIDLREIVAGRGNLLASGEMLTIPPIRTGSASSLRSNSQIKSMSRFMSRASLGTASLGTDRRIERFFDLAMKGPTIGLDAYRPALSSTIRPMVRTAASTLAESAGSNLSSDFAVHRGERGLRLGKLALQLIKPGKAGHANTPI